MDDMEMDGPLRPSNEVVLHETREHIRQAGWAAIGIEADDDTPTFMYTAGLSETIGHAELVLVGLPVGISHSVLAAAVTRAIEGKGFVDGERRSDVLTGLDVIVHALDGEECSLGFGVLDALYGRSDVPVLQLYWPDEDGRMPGEPEADDIVHRQLIG